MRGPICLGVQSDDFCSPVSPEPRPPREDSSHPFPVQGGGACGGQTLLLQAHHTLVLHIVGSGVREKNMYFTHKFRRLSEFVAFLRLLCWLGAKIELKLSCISPWVRSDF